MQTTCIFCLSSAVPERMPYMAATTAKPVKNAGKIPGSTLKDHCDGLHAD